MGIFIKHRNLNRYNFFSNDFCTAEQKIKRNTDKKRMQCNRIHFVDEYFILDICCIPDKILMYFFQSSADILIV